MKVLGVIPARYASSRFPGKPLVDILGTSMIMRVYNRCLTAKSLDKVIVATDDERIFEHVQQNGGEVLMTSREHRNGTERVAEVLRKLDGYDYAVNIQGDEPCIQGGQIDQLVNFLKENTNYPIGTLARKPVPDEMYKNPHAVKVLVNLSGNAKLFFRKGDPDYFKQPLIRQWNTVGKHIGMYGFKTETLSKLVELPPSENELKHSLEQLRWKDNGYEIGVAWTEYLSPGVDVPEDLENVRRFLQEGKD